MDELPRRHDITIRVAKEEGHHPDPAAFAVAASRAAAGRNASIVSAHTAEEIICVVSVPAAGRPDAVAIALAVVADALTPAGRSPHGDDRLHDLGRAAGNPHPRPPET